MLIAVEITWNADKQRIDRAAVTADGRIGIVCARTDDSSWEPLYLITREAERRELPSCFSLSGEAVEVLNDLALSTEGMDYPKCPICNDPIDYCQGHGESSND